MAQQSIPRRLIIVEIFNALTHGLSALGAIVFTYFLIRKGIIEHSLSHGIAYCVYGLSLFGLFMSSTLYHSFSFSRLRSFFRSIDHAMIYCLIAGTYTPYLMVTLQSTWGLVLLGIVWGLAILGIIFELRWMDRYPRLSVALYLLLGWLSLLIIYPLSQKLPLPGLLLLAAGGVCYTIGTIFYRMKSKPWMHVIWHLFVTAGASCMALSIYFYV